MKTKKKYMAWMIAFTLLLEVIPSAQVSAAKKISLSSKKITITKGKTKTLKVKNAKYKVRWEVLSGKKCISLKNKGSKAGEITGKKKGTAKVQAIIGKKELTCKVIVKNAATKNTSKPGTATTPVPTDKPSTSATPEGTADPTNTPLPANPTNAPEGADAQDVSALEKLIRTHRERGAMVSDNMSDCRQYTWENGRLTGLCWQDQNLSGELDVTAFTALQVLDCGKDPMGICGGPIPLNRLTSLKASNNTALTKLSCGMNQLTSLDVSNCTALVELSCSDNQLTSLDVSSCSALVRLSCDYNKLTSLDVSNCTALVDLSCYFNELAKLDVSDCTALKQLSCSYNQLTSLDLSSNIYLGVLHCEYNQLTSLDLSNNIYLEYLVCDDSVTVTGYKK